MPLCENVKRLFTKSLNELVTEKYQKLCEICIKICLNYEFFMNFSRLAEATMRRKKNLRSISCASLILYSVELD